MNSPLYNLSAKKKTWKLVESTSEFGILEKISYPTFHTKKVTLS